MWSRVCVCVCVCLCVLSPPVHPAVIGYLVFAGVQIQCLSHETAMVPVGLQVSSNPWFNYYVFIWYRRRSRVCWLVFTWVPQAQVLVQLTGRVIFCGIQWNKFITNCSYYVNITYSKEFLVPINTCITWGDVITQHVIRNTGNMGKYCLFVYFMHV